VSPSRPHNLEFDRPHATTPTGEGDYQPIDTEVFASSWDGTGEAKKGKGEGKRTIRPGSPVSKLPSLPPPRRAVGSAREEGKGGKEKKDGSDRLADSGVHSRLIADATYEIRLISDGYKPERRRGRKKEKNPKAKIYW